MKTLITMRFSRNHRGIERRISTEQMPTKSDFLSGKIPYIFRCSCGRHAYSFHISPETVTVVGFCSGGAGTVKKNVPHTDALSLLVDRCDPTVLFELRILGLFVLVETIRRKKRRIKEKVTEGRFRDALAIIDEKPED